MVQSWFQKLFWNQNCDVVGNLVVEIEILNFSLFVCLLVCLYLTFCQFRKRKMVQSWFQKLFWNQDCDVVSNLVVEIAIYNFDLFHSALLNKLSTAFTAETSGWQLWQLLPAVYFNTNTTITCSLKLKQEMQWEISIPCSCFDITHIIREGFRNLKISFGSFFLRIESVLSMLRFEISGICDMIVSITVSSITPLVASLPFCLLIL